MWHFDSSRTPRPQKDADTQHWDSDELFRFYDVDGDGNVSPEEFLDGRLPSRHGEYRWICYSVEDEEKELKAVRKKAGMDTNVARWEDAEFEDSERQRLRKAATSMTQTACRKQSYPYNGKIILLQDVALMEKGTRWFYHDDSSEPVKGPLSLRSVNTVWKSFHQEGEEVHSVALNCPEPSRVACVNLASAYFPACGFYEGSAHYVTDAVHMRSTLSRSFAQADVKRLTVPPTAKPSRPRSGGQWKCHLPWNGVLLSPHVEFFRGSRYSGYPFETEATTLAAVISVAMPCCVEVPDFQPVDRPDGDDEYNELLVQKLRATLGAAMFAGATVVVVPDMADATYGNDSIDVGWALGESVRRYFPHEFDEIRIVGNKEFAAVAEASYRGEMALDFWKNKVNDKFKAVRKDMEEKQAEVDEMFRMLQKCAQKLEEDRREIDAKVQELEEREMRGRGLCFICPS